MNCAAQIGKRAPKTRRLIPIQSVPIVPRSENGAGVVPSPKVFMVMHSLALTGEDFSAKLHIAC